MSEREQSSASTALLTERINQLGWKPDLNPDGVSSRAASEYVEDQSLVDMIKRNSSPSASP
jgi:bacterioferritin